MSEITLFRAGDGGFDNYRIPAIACTDSGVLLAACEARRSDNDWSAKELHLRRSTDGGKTWSQPTVLAKSDKCLNNPLFIADGGLLHFLWLDNYSTLNYQVSTDDGESFSSPVALDGVFEGFPWQGRAQNARAVGPGHGAVTPDGTLIVPMWFAYGEGEAHHPSRAGCLLGFDHGTHWEAGGIYENAEGMFDISENSIAVLPDGRLYANLRSEHLGHRRAEAFSNDCGRTWSLPILRDDLPDPICLGNVAAGKGASAVSLFFVNCADTEKRLHLTLRESLDGGVTWDSGTELSYYAGYPDLAISPDGRKCYVLYEHFVPGNWEIRFTEHAIR